MHCGVDEKNVIEKNVTIYRVDGDGGRASRDAAGYE